jgi:hypothetical protein
MMHIELVHPEAVQRGMQGLESVHQPENCHSGGQRASAIVLQRASAGKSLPHKHSLVSGLNAAPRFPTAIGPQR